VSARETGVLTGPLVNHTAEPHGRDERQGAFRVQLEDCMRSKVLWSCWKERSDACGGQLALDARGRVVAQHDQPKAGPPQLGQGVRRIGVGRHVGGKPLDFACIGRLDVRPLMSVNNA
jgi:hypothetical protein